MLKVSMNSTVRVNPYFNIFQDLSSTLGYKCPANSAEDMKRPELLLRMLQVAAVVKICGVA